MMSVCPSVWLFGCPSVSLSAGASFAPARLPPDTLCTTCMKVVERMKQLVDAGQVIVSVLCLDGSDALS